jgi:hypothetical protein
VRSPEGAALRGALVTVEESSLSGVPQKGQGPVSCVASLAQAGQIGMSDPDGRWTDAPKQVAVDETDVATGHD